MSAPNELKLLRSIKTGKGLIKLIVSLRTIRRREKDKDNKRKMPTKKQRQEILDKTDGRCHVCGIEIVNNEFHADHVQSNISGGSQAINNFLACCSTCNNLRWHYSSEEIQVIMKLGRWLKTKLLEDSEEALALANAFVRHEMGLRKRRKLK